LQQPLTIDLFFSFDQSPIPPQDTRANLFPYGVVSARCLQFSFFFFYSAPFQLEPPLFFPPAGWFCFYQQVPLLFRLPDVRLNFYRRISVHSSFCVILPVFGLLFPLCPGVGFEISFNVRPPRTSPLFSHASRLVFSPGVHLVLYPSSPAFAGRLFDPSCLRSRTPRVPPPGFFFCGWHVLPSWKSRKSYIFSAPCANVCLPLVVHNVHQPFLSCLCSRAFSLLLRVFFVL